jgi:hypothetical protein
MPGFVRFNVSQMADPRILDVIAGAMSGPED